MSGRKNMATPGAMTAQMPTIMMMPWMKSLMAVTACAVVATECTMKCVMGACCCADSRCYLSNHDFIRIFNCFPYFIRITSLAKCSDRTMCNALTTKCTICLSDRIMT